MSINLLDYALPTSDSFTRHPDSIAERVRRQRFFDSIPSDAVSSRGQGRHRPKDERFTPQLTASTSSCPLDPYWRDWDMFRRDYFFARIGQEELAVCSRARRVRPLAHRCRVPLVWVLDQGEPPPSRPLPPSGIPPLVPHTERHIHAETFINHRLVHIDVVSLTKYSPGRSVGECRVFRDGELAGRGGRCGSSIGVGGYCLPAVALVDVGVAITVDLIEDEHGPIVELWDVTDGTATADSR